MTAIASPQSSVQPRKIATDAPWTWLAKGWADLWVRPDLSLGYGIAFVGAGFLITIGLWSIGLSSIIPAIGAGFMLVGPILAVGLYEISRRRKEGLPLRLSDILFVRSAARVQLAYMGFFLTFLFLVWIRIATLLFALFISGNYVPLEDFISFVLTDWDGITMLVTGTIIGGGLALIAFAMSVISVPYMMDKDVDVATAIMTSFKAVRDNPGPMLLWAWLIFLLIGFGLATLFVGLIIVFPLVGHATWHAYQDLVGSDPS